jgi:CheY-specific phosphatase CheX
MPLHERDIHYFIEVTVAYLNKITGNEIVLRDPSIEFQSLVFSACTGLIHLKGKAEGFAYLTTSQQFLQNLHAARHHRERFTDETSRDVMTEITTNIVQNVQKRFGADLELSAPHVFSTVPDDPIEMPPAVFVQPIMWRKEHAYFVLGLASSETTTPL